MLLKKGFTLIELLVFLAIFSVLSVMITTVLISFFRNENKIAAINNVRQYGSAIIDNFERDVRASQDLTRPDPPSICGALVDDCLNINITDPTEGTVTVVWRCKRQTFDTVERLILTRESTHPATGYVAVESEVTNGQVGISLTSCTDIFTVLGSLGSSKLVNLKFTLQSNPGSGQESSAQVPFQTSVSTRNEK